MTGDVAQTAPVTLPSAGTDCSVLAFDGLRAAACLLVVLTHSWVIVPARTIERVGPLEGALLSSNLAITVLLVLGGFAVTRQLLDEESRTGTIRVRRFYARRLSEFAPHLILLVAVLVVVSWFDGHDDWTMSQTHRSALGVLTFTYNWTLMNHPFDARPDVGHLWYLSVEQQILLVLVPVLYVFRRHRTVVATALACVAAGAIIWRFRKLETDGWWPAALSTTSRSDGLLLGASAALLAPRLRRFRAIANRVTTPSLLVLCGLVLLIPELGPRAYLEYQGVVAVFVTALLVLALSVANNPDGRVERWLTAWPLRVVATMSLPLFIWHLPIYYASARWLTDWHWSTRAAVALITVAAVVTCSQMLVDRPIARRLHVVAIDDGGAELLYGGSTARNDEVAGAPDGLGDR